MWPTPKTTASITSLHQCFASDTRLSPPEMMDKVGADSFASCSIRLSDGHGRIPVSKKCNMPTSTPEVASSHTRLHARLCARLQTRMCYIGASPERRRGASGAPFKGLVRPERCEPASLTQVAPVLNRSLTHRQGHIRSRICHTHVPELRLSSTTRDP